MICRDALEPADRNGLSVDSSSPAGRLARPIASAPENAREHVGFPIDHIGIRIPALRDKPDIFGHVSMRGASPLTVHYLVEIVRVVYVSRFHSSLSGNVDAKLCCRTLLYTWFRNAEVNSFVGIGNQEAAEDLWRAQ